MSGKACPMGKTRPESDPWLVVEDGTGWVWRVLKAYTADPDKPYARWFCAVSSPFTQGGSDWGDTYTADVRGYVTHRDPSVPDEALPRHLRGREARAVASVGGITVVDITPRKASRAFDPEALAFLRSLGLEPTD